MDYSVDVGYELKKAQSKLFRAALLFSIILTIIIVGDVLLVALAKEDYLVNLIIAIVITILFSWFAIYFFFNIYSELNNRYRFYKGYDAGIHPVEEVEFIKTNGDITYLNGLYVYPIVVKYHEGLTEKDKVIYTLNADLNYQEGDKLRITTYQRVIIKAEYHI